VRLERNLYSFEDKRLARLLRQASLCYVRRELGRTQSSVQHAIELVEWANRPEWNLGLAFLKQWYDVVQHEQKGRSGACAPAAWIHLAQELAALLETEGDWIAYLGSRWRLEEGSLSRSQRIAYTGMGISALGLGALVLGTTTYGLLAGEITLAGPASLLILGRLLGAALMVEHGFYWSRRALSGRSEEPESVFLPAHGGLTLVR